MESARTLFPQWASQNACAIAKSIQSSAQTGTSPSLATTSSTISLSRKTAPSNRLVEGAVRLPMTGRDRDRNSIDRAILDTGRRACHQLDHIAGALGVVRPLSIEVERQRA